MEERLFSLVHAGSEYHHDRSYFHDNAERVGEPVLCVVQLTIKGCGYIEVAGKRQRVSANHAMLFRHGEDSRYGHEGRIGELYHQHYVAIVGGGVLTIFDELQQHFGSVMPIPSDSVAGMCMGNLVDRYLRRGFSDRYQQSLLIYEFLMALLKLQGDERAGGDPVDRAREYILSNYQRPITQEDVAQVIGSSREHLARCYRARYGTSPGKHCAELRMARARMLLRITGDPIEQVALVCGYIDVSSFGRAFRNSEGVAPSAYRSQFQGYSSPR